MPIQYNDPTVTYSTELYTYNGLIPTELYGVLLPTRVVAGINAILSRSVIAVNMSSSRGVIARNSLTSRSVTT